jgi:hypothetical protein
MRYVARPTLRGSGIPYLQRSSVHVQKDHGMTIASLSATPNSTFYVDGIIYRNETAGQSYSVTSPDASTLRLELHDGDHAWFDSGSVERSQVERIPRIQTDTPVNVSYQFMLEPGAANTASWFVTGEMHNDDSASGVPTSPPFAVELAGEHLRIVARYAPTGTDPSNAAGNVNVLPLWTDPNPIQRGQYYDIKFQANFDNTSNGSLDVWINGNQVVDYNGPLGYGYPVYWVEGPYRSADGSQAVAANYRNFTLTTGSTAPVTEPTQPTTPTSPITPTNLAPTVTQASASPGTGIADNGDTITLTLGFSEAVTVSGTPTLSLNDGANATYAGGSGTSSLTFKTTVAATDTDTSALAITGVNLPSGASIKDASGLAANLSGAVKTFTGLQIDATPSSPTSPTTPTAPTTPTTPTTPSVTTPVLTVADPTLSVTGRGGTVDLGVTVSTTDPNDNVTVNVKGLASYETITDGLGDTFKGRNITLTEAQVDSGLTLHSYYRGSRDPVDTITLTATAKDPVTGAVTTSAPQRITVADAPSATAPTTTVAQTTTVTAPAPATSTSSPELLAGLNPDPGTSTVTASAPQPITVTDAPSATTTTTASPTSPGSALLSQIRDLAADGVATFAPQAINVTDHSPATSTTTASLASQSFALLNQYMAANPGRVDPGQIVAAAPSGITWGQDSFLTRPQQ